MSCATLIQGNIRDCEPNLGGIRRIYLGPLDWNLETDEGTPYVVPPGKATGTTESIIAAARGKDGFTVNDFPEAGLDLAGEYPLVKYDIPKSGAVLTSTPSISEENGSIVIENRLEFPIDNLNAARRLDLSLLLNADCWAIVEDNKGNTVILGCPVPGLIKNYVGSDAYKTTPLRLVEGPATTGSGFAEANRATVALVSYSNLYPIVGTGDLQPLEKWVYNYND